MIGKYSNYAAYWTARLRRGLLRTILQRLVRWTAMADPVEGYSIIIGCRVDLLGVLRANLTCLRQQRLQHLRELVLVFDESPSHLPGDFETKIASTAAGLPVRFAYYAPSHVRLIRALRWGWANAWLSWSLGISEVRSQYAVLHDLDALLLNDDFLEERYHRIRAERLHYLGMRYYVGNGVIEEHSLVTTFEMFFDAAYVRSRFLPIDLFNHVQSYENRTVDFDTFLYAQSRGGRRAVSPGRLEDIVHPSQMICQYLMQLSGSNRLPAGTNNLLLIPYFMYLGGELELLAELTRHLEARTNPITLFGRPYRASSLTADHAAWITKQTHCVETALHSRVRPEVRRYCDAITRIASAGRP